jgi:hypothetical protein
VQAVDEAGAGLPGVGVVLGPLGGMLVNALIGLVAGAVVLAVVMLAGKLWRRSPARA